MGRPFKDSNQKPAKDKLLEAAFKLIRSKGYVATTVDHLCEEAKVTKGTFFHYFESKEALGVAAANHWSLVTSQLFKEASYHKHADPLKRVLAYIDLRNEMLQGELEDFTCLVGTMTQEIYLSNPEIKEACQQSIWGHAEKLEQDISDAKKLYAPKAKFTAKGLALHTQAVIQGAFIMAKADGGPKVASESIHHLKNYVQLLFNSGSQNPSKKASKHV